MKSENRVDLFKDTNFKAFIDRQKELETNSSNLSLAEERKMNAQSMSEYYKERESVNRIVDFEIPGRDNHKIPLRIYIPNATTSLPVMVYFHGGGWVFGSVEEADAVCRRLSNHLGCIIASVDYRLAPEFPFPKPLEDAYEAVKWVSKNTYLFGGDGENVFVGGESAGGNLAGAVALMARDNNGPKLSAQLLIYPVISPFILDEIYDKCPDQYFLTKEAMKYFWSQYIQNEEDLKNPYAALDFSSKLENLPKTLIVTAEYDPLAYDGEKYSSQLQNAKVTVIHKSFAGLIHGFLDITLYEESQKVEWTKEIGELLRKLDVLKRPK
ncbi:alpha/beta hydrolase [Criblamydia sequanensis]|nr:alpha/beta hydrolase [Criblamydia sequanensis]